MRVDDNGKKLIKDFEGLRLKPYLCSASVPTIGYGTTRYPNGFKVTLKDKAITEKQADAFFDNDIIAFEKDLNTLIKGLKLTQNQYNALLSFGYNLGMDIDIDMIAEGLGDSTLLKLIKKNPLDGNIAKEFLKWNKAKGKINKGLTNRRIKESALYFTN
jgi:lysozyme